MKAWAWLAAVSILGSIAHAESLGEVAKRERERREKNKRQGTETKVINDDDLTAGRDKDSKGTFNPGAGLATGRGGAGASGPSKGSTPPSPSASPAGGDAVTEVDVRRAGARQRLESSYEKIAGEAWSAWRSRSGSAWKRLKRRRDRGGSIPAKCVPCASGTAWMIRSGTSSSAWFGSIGADSAVRIACFSSSCATVGPRPRRSTRSAGSRSGPPRPS